jgi:hypothetical protein
MAYEGADIDRLRSAAMQFDQVANSLESAVGKVHALANMPWLGPVYDQFFELWMAVYKPAVGAAVNDLRDGSKMLKTHADRQQQVSARLPGTNSALAPTGTAGLFNAIHQTDGSGDGVMVQQVYNPKDHTTRFIVYINGTNSNPRMPWWENGPAGLGITDPHIAEKIKAALEAAGYRAGADGTFKNGPEVMLVGYSLGGIDAQEIAASHQFNVTDLVTYGSPLVTGDQRGVNTIHLRDDNDTIPYIPAVIETAVGGVAGEEAAATGSGYIVPVDQPWAGPSQNIYEKNSGVPIEGIWGNHADPQTYLTVGGDFDTDPATLTKREHLARFQGDIVGGLAADPKSGS